MRFRKDWPRVMRWLVVPAIIVSLLAQVPPHALANDPRAELDRALDRQKYIAEQKKQATNDLARVYWETEEVTHQLRQVENDLALANSRLALLTNDLVVARRNLEQVEEELSQAQGRYDASKFTLAMRIRAINEEGRVNYLGVLLGATTFSDFLSRFDMLKLIVQRDSKLFDQIRVDKTILESRQVETIDYRNWLQRLRADAEIYRAEVEEQRTRRQSVSRNLEISRSRLEAQLDEIERLEQIIGDEIAEIQRRLARAAGRFVPIHPLRGNPPITSDFGPRIHPILGTWRTHSGTDFGAPSGEPIYAIEDGQVIVARWDDVYGWLTVIDHGGGVASWYAHASRLLTQTGDQVKRGDRIALVGSTGMSTGPHLHLEIRVDGKPEDPMSYIK
jgi:murein DD-endopeptidase MepM/ murein hydrolase activator NlpD